MAYSQPGIKAYPEKSGSYSVKMLLQRNYGPFISTGSFFVDLLDTGAAAITQVKPLSLRY
jgi:hypothetical protein